MQDAKLFIDQARAPKQEDRATIVLQGNYQELNGDSKYIRYAYDRVLPSTEPPFQGPQRVNPGTPTPVYIGTCEFRKCELFLGHNVAKLSGNSGTEDLLAKAQKSNKIIITNADGVVLAEILPNRALFCHFTGPVFAHSTSATAILHVTAFPE